MNLTEIKNNMFNKTLNKNERNFNTNNEDNILALNSLRLAVKAYLSTYQSMKNDFDKFTYKENHRSNYFEIYSEVILHFQHFFELLIKDVLKDKNKLLAFKLSKNDEFLISLIEGLPIKEEKYINSNTLEFRNSLERLLKYIELKRESDYDFIKENKEVLIYLSELRNSIWHKGENILTYTALDNLIAKYILPLAEKFLENLNYLSKYDLRNIVGLRKSPLNLNIIKEIKQEIQNKNPKYDRIAVLKELGRASLQSHYGMGFGSMIDSKDKSAHQLALAELQNDFSSTNEIITCPSCNAKSLVTYTTEVITDCEEIEYEDIFTGQIVCTDIYNSYETVNRVKCVNCSFELLNKGIKNLKEYGLEVEDYWKDIDYYK